MTSMRPTPDAYVETFLSAGHWAVDRRDIDSSHWICHCSRKEVFEAHLVQAWRTKLRLQANALQGMSAVVHETDRRCTEPDIAVVGRPPLALIGDGTNQHGCSCFGTPRFRRRSSSIRYPPVICPSPSLPDRRSSGYSGPCVPGCHWESVCCRRSEVARATI